MKRFLTFLIACAMVFPVFAIDYRTTQGAGFDTQ